MWQHTKVISNILSLAWVKNIYHVIYDITKGNWFTFQKVDGGTRCFLDYPQWLYCINTKNTDVIYLLTVDDKYNGSVISYIDTAPIIPVDYNRSVKNRHSYLKAQLARKMQRIDGRPSTKDYKHYSGNNDTVDCPISLAVVNTAGDIFEKDKGSLQCKTIQSKTNQLQSTQTNIIKYIMERYQSVTLSTNFIFVNGIPLLITTSHYINFITDLMKNNQCIKPML